MDLFEKPKELTKEEKKEIVNPQKHFKRFLKKKPVEKFISKKLSWREEDL